MNRLLTLLALSAFFSFQGMTLAQTIISGQVVDSISRAPLADATILLDEGPGGTTTDTRGTFSITYSRDLQKLTISNVGYQTKIIRLPVAGNNELDLGIIELNPASIGLVEVLVIAPEARDRRTPVAASSIDAGQIETRLGDEPFPEIMKTTPGVYATRQGGGSGDASVNIRGFKQENVALLLNGVPISSVENGLVYWNNWLGLAEATQQVQVQRGLGASNTALNSVGGTINIITRTTDIERGGSLKFSMTDYGNSKFNVMLSTGRLKNNMAVTFLGTRISGPGYVDATYVEGWAYFLSISKEINKKHMLVLTLLGNPEKHGQRNFKLSKAETDRYGLKYNKDWGSYNGTINNASENFYHKPNISLNHYWDISQRSFLATSVYVSTGKGGGKWTETFGYNPWIFSYYNPSGQLDWPAIYERNHDNQDIYTLANGTDTSGFSVNIQTDFLASHIWTGVISTFKHSFNDHLRLVAGVHGRHFKSTLQQKVRDLLGGEFFIDDYAYAIEGVAGRDQIRHTGDIVKVDNGAVVEYLSGFSQLEYSKGWLSLFAAGSLSGTWYMREDRYNYISNTKSDWVSRPGADLKAGANLNISEYHHIYLNGGYFSIAPYFKYVFANYNNVPTGNLKNEKVQSVEVGYGFDRRSTRIRLNAYLSRWQDKSVLTNEYNQFEDPVMLKGLDAVHKGIEAEVMQRVTSWMGLSGLLSFGDWKWKNDVSALLYNKDNVVVDTINVYADGLFVGDAPQFQAGLAGDFRLLGLFDLEVQWVYYDRFYADFNPTSRTKADDRAQPLRLPSYQLLDLFAGYGFNIGSTRAYLQASCYNLLNQRHIIRGEDGTSHTMDDFRGFWGLGRTFNFSFKLSF